jgi:rhodanese-related sulfurtransferase/DNA-binding transcriptional ArsR family regulator
MSTDATKQALYQAIARVAQALSSANRLLLLDYLAQCDRSVDELATMTGMSVANTSQHLQALRQAALVSSRKEAQRVYYRIAGNDVLRMCQLLRGVAENKLAEVDRLVRDFVGSRGELEAIPAEEVLDRARKGLVLVLDVRPPEEYAAGHLPGAVNIPIKELEARLASLPKRKEIVAYCRGAYCVWSFEALERLHRRGFRARRLKDGFPGWRASGLPVEK